MNHGESRINLPLSIKNKISTINLIIIHDNKCFHYMKPLVLNRKEILKNQRESQTLRIKSVII